MEKRAPRKKPRLTEGKKNIIQSLIEKYHIETVEDTQATLKDLLGGTIENMLQAEMNYRLGYEAYERSDEENYRNGLKPKKLRNSYG